MKHAHTLPYVKQMTSASSMHEAGHPRPVLWNNPEGYGGKGYKEKVSRQEQLAHLINGDHVRGLEIGASCPRQPELQETLRISH